MKDVKALRSIVLVAAVSVAVLSFLPSPAAADGGGLGGAAGDAIANCLADADAYDYWSSRCVYESYGMLVIDGEACANADAARAAMNRSCGAS